MTRESLAARVVDPPSFDKPPFPPDMLAGRVALVTGGASGMGLAMARAFAQAGADVAIVGRTTARLEGAVLALEEFPGRMHALACDVRDPDGVAAAFDEVEGVLGPVDILANNAGANFPSLAEEMSANTWRTVVTIAVNGTFSCSAEFARRRPQRAGGVVINNSAQYIYSGFPGDAHSASAKAAIAHMTTQMARDLRPRGVRVNCIAAGFFPHEGTPGGLDDPDHLSRLAAMIPAGRTGQIREFGWLAAFLASDLASGITGETLVIDGADRLRRALFSEPFVPPRERANPWGVADDESDDRRMEPRARRPGDR